MRKGLVMRCEENVERIARMLEGALPDDEQRELRAHLSACAHCRVELLLQQKIDRVLVDAKPAGLSADFTARVAARTAARSEEGRRAPWWVSLVSAASIVAALAALAGVGAAVVRSGDDAGGTLAGAIARPLASMAAVILDTLRALAPSFGDPSLLGPIPQGILHTFPWFLLSGIALLWSMSKAFSFLRE
jgi:hypothetical protein